MNRRSFNWLLMTLLLGNLVLFFWPATQLAEPQAGMPAGVTHLVLLSELPQGIQSAPTEAELKSKPEPEPELETDALTLSGDGARPETGLTVVPADSKVRGSTVRGSTPLSCWLAGPVDDVIVQQRLEATLTGHGLTMDLVLRQVLTEPDYWVHMPLQGSVAEQRAVRSELRGKGLDNFPIQDGELAGALSLGLFRSEARARGVMQRVQQLGYQASIFERPRSQEEVWVALDSADLRLLGWPLQSGPLTVDPALQLRARSCNGVDLPQD